MSDLIVPDSDQEINTTPEPSRYIEKCLAHLDSLYEQIQAYEKKAKELREHANSQAAHFIKSAPTEDERKEIASSIYWERDGFISADIVWGSLGIYPQQAHSRIYPGVVRLNCADCGAEMETTVTSRTAAREILAKRRLKYQICPNCAQIRADQRKEDSLQYEKQVAEYHAEIARLRTMPYAEYLKTDHWQNMRRKMLKRAGFSCQLCNASGVSLHVHHRTYERRGQEAYSDLIVLCADCHETFHMNGVLS